jgi:hypothetical protein
MIGTLAIIRFQIDAASALFKSGIERSIRYDGGLSRHSVGHGRTRALPTVPWKSIRSLDFGVGWIGSIRHARLRFALTILRTTKLETVWKTSPLRLPRRDRMGGAVRIRASCRIVPTMRCVTARIVRMKRSIRHGLCARAKANVLDSSTLSMRLRSVNWGNARDGLKTSKP